MRNKLEDLKFDGMPKEKNKLYHIVSKEWFEDWKLYVQMPTGESQAEEKEPQKAPQDLP